MESLAATCLGGEPFALSSESHIPQAYCSPDKTTEYSRLSRYGMTFAPLTDDRGEEVLTWFLADFLVRTYPQPDSALASMESSQDCGEKPRELLAKFSPASFSWKTVQCSLLADSGECFVTWPDSGSTRNGDAFLRSPLERITGVKESGLLPTPSGTTNHGKNHVVGRLDEWGGSSNPWRGIEIGRTRSPSFEEWIMGWPVSWTELMPYATDKFHKWQRQHSPCFAIAQVGDA